MPVAQIRAIRTVSGNSPLVRRLPEEANQAFKPGVPVMLAADGGVEEWDGTTTANAIVGFSLEAASGLAATGQPKAQFATLSQANVPFQPSAVTVPEGSPLNDGRVGVEIATPDSIFFAEIGPSQTRAATDIGQSYGLTKEASSGQWYVDKTKTGASAVVKVVALDQNDPQGVHIQVLPSAANLLS